MRTPHLSNDTDLIEKIREDFWLHVSASPFENDLEGLESGRPAWHAVVSRFGVWGLVLVGSQAVTAVSLGRFCAETGWVSKASWVSAPVFLLMLLLNGLAAWQLPGSECRAARWSLLATLAGCALTMWVTQPSGATAWSLSELVTGLSRTLP